MMMAWEKVKKQLILEIVSEKRAGEMMIQQVKLAMQARET